MLNSSQGRLGMDVIVMDVIVMDVIVMDVIVMDVIVIDVIVMDAIVMDVIVMDVIVMEVIVFAFPMAWQVMHLSTVSLTILSMFGNQIFSRRSAFVFAKPW